MKFKIRPWIVRGIVAVVILALSGCLQTSLPDENATPQPSSVVSMSVTDGPEFVLAHSDLHRELAPQAPQDELAELVLGNSEFAFDLYQAIRGEKGNLFYSPVSISTALATIFAGARGETERQMAKTLHFTLPQAQLHPAFNVLDLRLNAPNLTDTDAAAFQLHVINSLWAQLDFEIRKEYLDLVAANYGAGVRLVDFINDNRREQARLAINQWVKDETDGKIEELIGNDVLTEFTRLVLANAIYFKGKWEAPFLNGTSDGDFFLLDGSRVSVAMMSRRAETPYGVGPDYQAIMLPYKGGRAEMMIILPDEGRFEAVEGAIDYGWVRQASLDLEQRDVKLYLPKFEYESSLDLVKTLSAMGMPDAFDTDKADFTGIIVNPRPRLFIKHVLHKAVVAVDEIGTEAAAATAVIAEDESMPVVVRIDRPFLFLILDREDGTILFMGRVLDPTS
jgi:serpin B